jgi:hypothetical protein
MTQTRGGNRRTPILSRSRDSLARRCFQPANTASALPRGGWGFPFRQARRSSQRFCTAPMAAWDRERRAAQTGTLRRASAVPCRRSSSKPARASDSTRVAPCTRS